MHQDRHYTLTPNLNEIFLVFSNIGAETLLQMKIFQQYNGYYITVSTFRKPFLYDVTEPFPAEIAPKCHDVEGITC